MKVTVWLHYVCRQVNWCTSSNFSTTHHHNHYLLKASACSMAPDTTVLKSIPRCHPVFIEWLATSFSVDGHLDQHDHLLTIVKDTSSMSCAIEAKKNSCDICNIAKNQGCRLEIQLKKQVKMILIKRLSIASMQACLLLQY